MTRHRLTLPGRNLPAVGPPARPERFELWDVTVPMRRGLRSATGAITERRSIVVAVTAGDVTGWGEAAPVTGHSLDTADEAWILLEALAELVSPARSSPPSRARPPPPPWTPPSPTWPPVSRVAAAVHLGGAMEPVPASVAIDLPRSGPPCSTTSDEAAPPATATSRSRSTRPRSATSPPSGKPASRPRDRRRRQRHLRCRQRRSAGRARRLGLDYVEQPFPAGDGRDHRRAARPRSSPRCASTSPIRTIADITGAAGLADAVALKPGRLGPTLTRRAMAWPLATGSA